MSKTNLVDGMIIEALYKAGYQGAFLQDHEHEALHMFADGIKDKSRVEKVQELIRCIKIIKPYVYQPGDEEVPDLEDEPAVKEPT